MLYDGLEAHLEVFGTADPWHRWSIGRGECWSHRYRTDFYTGWWDDHTETSKSLQTALYKTHKPLQKKKKKQQQKNSQLSPHGTEKDAYIISRKQPALFPRHCTQCIQYHTKRLALCSHGTAQNAYIITQKQPALFPRHCTKHIHYHTKAPNSLPMALHKTHTLSHKNTKLSSHDT